MNNKRAGRIFLSCERKTAMSVNFSFVLDKDFVDSYRNKQEPFGFNGLGATVFYRTYSRKKDDGIYETWTDVCERVINGMYTIQKDYCTKYNRPWSDEKARASAEEAFDRLFNLKWSPSGRGLWMLGTEFFHERKSAEAGMNCAFISTKDIATAKGSIFSWFMEMLMLGVGVGGDVKGAGEVQIERPVSSQTYRPNLYVIPDTREGWAESVELLFNSYVPQTTYDLQPEPLRAIEFDYSNIRPAGSPISGFGGVAEGPEPLMKLHERMRKVLDENAGRPITVTTIADIFNQIGACVIAGNVRRSAEILLGDIDDHDEFLVLKHPALNEHRGEWSWASNNSVIAKTGEFYGHVADLIMSNGEPGIFWEDNVSKYGRMGELKPDNAIGVNPCGEQPLANREMCVSGDTRIQTETGVYNIKDIIDTKVKVWNGEHWSEVEPFYTGNNQLYRVMFSDGSYLDATPGHRWLAKTKTESVFHERTTTELQAGMILPEYSITESSGTNQDFAYELGWVAGDGYLDKENKKVMAIIQEDEMFVANDLEWNTYKKQQPDGYSKSFCRINFSDRITYEDGVALRDKNSGLPEIVMTMDQDSICQFLAGWIDTDGCVQKNKNTEHIFLYGSRQKLLDLQILIRRIGINHAAVTLFQEAGTETNFGIRNYDLYRLTIPSFECGNLCTKIKRVTKIGSQYQVNNAHKNSKPISHAARQKIVSIELISENEPTYCFTEDVNHMGVFGNVLTKQCNLVEVYLSNHKSEYDYQRTLKFAYLYGKTISLTYEWITDPISRNIMMENRRVGLSNTGVAQFVTEFGMSQLIEWLNSGYGLVKQYDNRYSAWLSVPKSIRLTTSKPSGTVSLLAGATPGVHYPRSEYYIRRVRIASSSPMVSVLRQAGFFIEDDQYSDNTVVVEFPIHVGDHIPSVLDLSIWEQLAVAAVVQKYWADNSVSVTVSFDPKKVDENEIERALNIYQYQLKAISMLPEWDSGTYAQMPYEEIDAKKYEELIANIDWSQIDNLRDAMSSSAKLIEKFCDGEACSI